MRTYFYKETFLILFISIIMVNLSSCNQNQNTEKPEFENKAIEAIMNRTSIRVYQDRDVNDDKIDILMKAAMAAPSGKNTQPWEFVVVKDRETLDFMAEGLPYAKMLKNTRQAIVVCGDSIKSFYWYLDCSTAAQNILIAAQSLGLGAVWTAAYPYEERMAVVKEAIKLPDNILPLCVIPFGYPEAPQGPKKKYKPSKVHRDRFKGDSTEK